MAKKKEYEVGDIVKLTKKQMDAFIDLLAVRAGLQEALEMVSRTLGKSQIELWEYIYQEFPELAGFSMKAFTENGKPTIKIHRKLDD